MFIVLSTIYLIQSVCATVRHDRNAEDAVIEVFDLTNPTTWKHLSDYYGAIQRQWKVCVNCGVPSLGTAMHLEYTGSTGSMHPAIIPTEYLLTRLQVIDVSHLTGVKDRTLTLETALQWMSLRHDPREPTLLLFKFGWTEKIISHLKRSCVCKIPGISYDLAEWIARNLSHVVGVATDSPTLESEQTRELSTRTVSNMLGRNGIYMIENVRMKKKMPVPSSSIQRAHHTAVGGPLNYPTSKPRGLKYSQQQKSLHTPERGCMAITMPLKMLNSYYVPTRLTAFCPMKHEQRVVIALKKSSQFTKSSQSRLYDVDLDEIMN